MDNKIIEKIQKLLSLSKSSNENEAKIALLKAQELLVKHKLTFKDVEGFVPLGDVTKMVTDISFLKANWKARLATIVAENFGCYSYLSKYEGVRSSSITFLGREEDVTVCNIVVQYAIDIIEKESNKIKNQYRRKGITSFKGLTDDYASGFLAGLRENFEAQKKNNQEWGLILMKDAEVVNAYENLEFQKVKLNVKSGGFKEAYGNGRKEGLSFNISDKVASGAETLSIS